MSTPPDSVEPTPSTSATVSGPGPAPAVSPTTTTSVETDRLPPGVKPIRWMVIAVTMAGIVGTVAFTVHTQPSARFRFDELKLRLPLVGPIPEVEGLFVASALNSAGVTWSAMTGQAITSQVLGRTPDFDVSALDPSRFGERSRDAAWLAEMASASVSLGYRRQNR